MVMKITIGQLRKIIREAIAVNSLNDESLSVLSKIARTRPRPEKSLKPAEQKIADELKGAGYLSWDLGSEGYTVTPSGLDALGKR